MTNFTVPTSLLLGQVISIYNALAVTKEYTVKVIHTYSCIAMRTRLKPLIESFEELNKEPQAITEYNKQKNELCAYYSRKDPAGDPILYNKVGTKQGLMSYDIDPEKSTEFQTKIRDLTSKNEEALKLWQAKIEQIQILLNQPATELKPGLLSPINLSWLKTEIPAEAVEALFPILVDDSTEVK